MGGSFGESNYICLMKKMKIRNFGFSEGIFFIAYNTGQLCWFDESEFILMYLDYCTYLGVDHKDLTSDMFDDFVNYGNEHFLLISSGINELGSTSLHYNE